MIKIFNRDGKSRRLLHGVVVLCVLCLLCALSALSPTQLGRSSAVSVQQTISNPVLPSSVTICGQTVDLDDADYYERLDRELTSVVFTHGNTLLLFKRANRYFPQIAPILTEQKMPLDLLYLACVESSLNVRALSGAKAAGLWQFIPSTAKEYGLEVTDEVDERYNIEKATYAACRYFKKALSRYSGNWLSVMASYNGGMARITKQLEAQGVSTAADLYLADETMRYPFRIIAVKMIMENPREYGFYLTADQLYQPRECDIVEVSGAVDSWAEWAKDHGTTYRLLREENPWIRDTKLTNRTGKTYKVRVPTKKSQKRSTSSQSVYNPVWICDE